MGNKIYLVVSGTYSDWRIDGYCTSKEKADLYVENANAQKLRYDEPYYTMAVDCIDDIAGVTRAYREISFDARQVNNAWSLVSFDDAVYVFGYKKPTVKDKRSEKKPHITITVRVPRMDVQDFQYAEYPYTEAEEAEEAKAEKIAQDTLYQYLAEHDVEGMTN